jgi:putative peptide zinc metalloprotease protein
MWHVLQDPSSNQFYRLNDAAYRFVAMLDGRRKIAEVWQICNEQFGDEAPTQGEAIQLLGQLYTSNLLQGEMPPDAEGLLKRYSQRRTREVRGYLMNLLFIRIPLFDPNRFLNRWVKLFGLVFTSPMFLVWLALVSTGLYFVVNNWSELSDQTQGVLNPDNLPLLYAAFALIKLFHEFGHAFACKKFGLKEGAGGDVHTIGIMFLVFTPLPYVDASSAWAFRSKWHRVIVGAAGMLIELGLAAIAAIVWANTASGTAIHALAYNAMFVASVSTLLFNGNPLLRYDAYYILSDILEIPNLSQRSKQYIYYIVKKYAWGVRNPRNPAHTRGEKGWFFFYGIASTIYRVFICFRILLFVADKLFFVGAALAVVALVAWVLVPIGKFIHYLATSGELFRCRTRAVTTTAATVAIVVILIGLIPMAERSRIEGVVEPEEMAFIFTRQEGFLAEYLPTDTKVVAGETVLMRLENRQLLAERDRLIAERRGLEGRFRLARKESVEMAQLMAEQIKAVDVRLKRIREMIDELTIRSPIDGTWVAPDVERAEGAWIQRNQRVGMVARMDQPMVRAALTQDDAGVLFDEIKVRGRQDLRNVEIRLKGRPPAIGGEAERITGEIRQIFDAGTQQLPSPAMGYAAGGGIATAPDDREGMRAARRFFELRIQPEYDPNHVHLLSGQRVVVRITMPSKPLARQWYRSLYQLVQNRFQG